MLQWEEIGDEWGGGIHPNVRGRINPRRVLADAEVILGTSCKSGKHFCIYGRDRLDEGGIPEGVKTVVIQLDPENEDTHELAKICYVVEAIKGRHELRVNQEEGPLPWALFKRSAGVGILLLSVLGSLLCLAGIVGVWTVKSRAEAVGEAVLGAAEDSLAFVDDKLDRVRRNPRQEPTARRAAFRGRRSGSRVGAGSQGGSHVPPEDVGRGGLPGTEVGGSPGSTRPTPLRWGWGGCPRR